MLQEDMHQGIKSNHQRYRMPPHDNHVCIKRQTHKSQTMSTSLQIRGGNFRVLLPNNQELKMRPYTRPQLSENVQNITRHNRFKRSLFAHQKQNYHIQRTIHKQKELHFHTIMHTDQTQRLETVQNQSSQKSQIWRALRN